MNNLKLKDKKELVKLIPIENISDSSIATLISSVLLSSSVVFVENEKIIHVIHKCNNKDLKLKILDRFASLFDYNDIDKILYSFGGVYRKATRLRNRPTWRKNTINLSIASKLHNMGYFRTVSTDGKDEIKIVVRYS